MKQKPWKTLPEQFIVKLAQLVQELQLPEVLEALSTKRPTTLRANTLKTSATDLQQELAELGVKLLPVSWWNNAFIVADTPLRELTQLPAYQEGKFYVQSLSSMLPPLILDPQLGDKILDITAAPGSKTTQMAALMQNKGEVIANDISHIRLLKLQANLRIQGVTNTKTIKEPGQMLWQKYPEYFDRTLVDVPCSMEGRFCSLDPKSYEDWSPRKIKDLVQKQRWLLRSAVSATKPGGVIVYSTCTLAPEENESIIDWILHKEAGALEIMPITIPNLELQPGLTHWKNKQYPSDMDKTIRVLPSLRMEGFFVAKLRKQISTIPKSVIVKDQINNS